MSIGIKIVDKTPRAGAAGYALPRLADTGSCNCCGAESDVMFAVDYAPSNAHHRNPNLFRVCAECLLGLRQLVNGAAFNRVRVGERVEFQTKTETQAEAESKLTYAERARRAVGKEARP